MDIRHCNPNSDFDIVEMLEKIYDHYNPPGNEHKVLVAVEGDQPIFRKIVRLWMDEVVARWGLM